MNKQNKTLLLAVLFCAIILPTMSIAQTKYTSQSIGIRVGTTSPYTDIRSHNYYRTIKTSGKSEYKPYVGVNYLYMFSTVLGIYADANMGSLQGVMSNRNKPKKDKNGNVYASEDYNFYQRLGYSRQIYFNTKIYDASINMYLNITNLAWFTKFANNKNAKPRRWAVYAYAGVGGVAYNPIVKALVARDQSVIDGENAYLHGYAFNQKTKPSVVNSVHDIMFPTAMGFKYNVSNAIDISADVSLRHVTTDKLDGVVNDAQKVNSKWIQNARYESYTNDKYALIGLNVNYKIGSNKPANNNIEWNDPQAALMKNVDAEMNKLKGLLNDADKDGVSDYFDKEPSTPAGVKVDGAGQALDVDGDGVADYKDEELFSPKGSTVSEAGIANDSDADGVPDVKDMEPNSKANALVNFRGITIGQRDSEVSTSTTNKAVFIFPSVYFDLNSAVIKPEFHNILADIAKTMIKYPYIRVNVLGNADQRGGDAFNVELGKRRAEAVSAYLKANFKLDPARINSVESNGRARPISDMHQPNRRVDLICVE